MKDEQYREFLTKALQCSSNSIKPGAAFYIWHADSERYHVEVAAHNVKLDIKQVIIWNKSSFVFGGQDYQWKHEPCLYGWKDGAAHYFIDDHTFTTVIDEKKPSNNKYHPTMKPIKLIGRLITNSSKQKDIVLDPFGGSGTTLIAAEQLNRTCYMMELDPKYADVIMNRYEELTGEKATLIKRGGNEE